MKSIKPDEQFKRSDLFAFLRHTMWLGAIYPVTSCSSKLLQLIEWLYEMLTYFISTHIILLYVCTIFINYDKGDLEFLVTCLMQTVIYLWTFFVKLYFRRIKPQQLNELMNFINNNYQTRSAPGFTYVTMTDVLKQSNSCVKGYICCCFTGAIFFCLLPIVSRDHSVPLTCWYPFDYNRPIIFEVVYLLQSIGQIQMAASFASSSGLHMLLSILISGQYDVLFCSLKNVIASSYIQMGANKEKLSELQEAQSVADAELNQYSYCVERHTALELLVQPPIGARDFRTTFKNCLKHCLTQHRNIISAMEKMERFYNPLWFLKVGEVTFLICLVAFVSTKSSPANSAMQMVSLGQYLLLVLIEFYILCYYSELIYQNSQRCGDALWRSPWHLHMKEVRSDYLFFLLNSKRHFQLTAGKMCDLNMDLYRATIKAAFSFLTMLQNVDNRN